MNPKLSASSQASSTRTSCRQQRLQPEFGPLPEKVKKEHVVAMAMNNAATMTNTTNPPVVLQQPRELPPFHGSPSEDPEDWLVQVERIKLFNCWDDETLSHVLFYHAESARTCFENHERSIEFWQGFMTQFLATFPTLVRKEQAEVLLQTQTQHPKEGVVVFVEEKKRSVEEKTLREEKNCLLGLCVICPKPLPNSRPRQVQLRRSSKFVPRSIAVAALTRTMRTTLTGTRFQLIRYARRSAQR